MGYSDFHSSWRFIVDWTSRMSQKYGGTVYEKNSSKTWDWGQALCREMYGIDWGNNPKWEEESRRETDQPCNPETLARAKSWEAGEIPEWVREERINE